MNGSKEQIYSSSGIRTNRVKWRRSACHLAANTGVTDGGNMHVGGICNEQHVGAASSTTGVHSLCVLGIYFSNELSFNFRQVAMLLWRHAFKRTRMFLCLSVLRFVQVTKCRLSFGVRASGTLCIHAHVLKAL